MTNGKCQIVGSAYDGDYRLPQPREVTVADLVEQRGLDLEDAAGEGQIETDLGEGLTDLPETDIPADILPEASPDIQDLSVEAEAVYPVDVPPEATEDIFEAETESADPALTDVFTPDLVETDVPPLDDTVEPPSDSTVPEDTMEPATEDIFDEESNTD